MTLLNTELLPTKTYPFAVIRKLLADSGGGLQEGAVGLSDFAVNQRGAGANYSVDVAAGSAWVQGDDSTRQGLYHQINDATVNVPIATPDPSNPRIDQVILKINDSSVLGSSDTPALQVVQGTPFTGAQAANPGSANYRAGAAALPNTALRLADVLVPAAAASIVQSSIQDRRRWARGGYHRVIRNTGISSDSYGPLGGSIGSFDAANLLFRLETSGLPVKVTMSGSFYTTTAAGGVQLGLAVDGALVAGSLQDSRIDTNSGTITDNLSYEFPLTVGAGLHTLEPWARSIAGSGVIVADSLRFFEITAQEQVRQDTWNG